MRSISAEPECSMILEPPTAVPILEYNPRGVMGLWSHRRISPLAAIRERVMQIARGDWRELMTTRIAPAAFVCMATLMTFAIVPDVDADTASGEWPTYGGDFANQRY